MTTDAYKRILSIDLSSLEGKRKLKVELEGLSAFYDLHKVQTEAIDDTLSLLEKAIAKQQFLEKTGMSRLSRFVERRFKSILN